MWELIKRLWLLGEMYQGFDVCHKLLWKTKANKNKKKAAEIKSEWSKGDLLIKESK